jgi:hypothetical protein
MSAEDMRPEATLLMLGGYFAAEYWYFGTALDLNPYGFVVFFRDRCSS